MREEEKKSTEALLMKVKEMSGQEIRMLVKVASDIMFYKALENECK